MKTLSFHNGDVMPALGLGTWKAAPGAVGTAVKAAVELGYRHIDCAAIYGNEAEIGTALADCFAAGIVKREDLWITSKLWNSYHGQAHVTPALQKTLQDLQLDYLDLYLIHWPVSLRHGIVLPETPEDFIAPADQPLSETWKGLEAAKTQGLCRHIGVSNFSLKKLQDLVTTADHLPEMNQVELHPYLQQQDLVDYCHEVGIGVTGYSPLGSRDRPESLRKEDEPVLLEDATIFAIARDHNASLAQVLLAWALQRGTAVIPKSVNPNRLAENLASTQLTLSDAEMRAIAQLDRHRRYVDGTFWTRSGSPYTLANLWDDA